MSKSVAKVILVGNVGKDLEVRSSPSGTPVAKLPGKHLAEIVGEFATKGSKVYVEGKIQVIRQCDEGQAEQWEMPF